LLFWQASEAITWVLLLLYFDGEANKGCRSIRSSTPVAPGRDGGDAGRLIIWDIVRPAGIWCGCR